MEELFINILGNSPTLVAVLLLYGRFDKRCAIIEHDVKEIQEIQKKCWFQS